MRKRLMITFLVLILFLISFIFVINTGKSDKENAVVSGSQKEVVNVYVGSDGNAIKETYSDTPN